MAPRKPAAPKTQPEKAVEEAKAVPALAVQSEETAPEKIEVKSKSALSRIEAVEAAIVDEAKKGAHAAEEEIAKVVHSPEAEKLENLSVEDLRKLHDDAIIAEDAAKRLLVVARQRAANMSSKVDDTVDREMIVLKRKVEEAHTWVKQIEEKLAGELKDIWGTTF